VVYTFMLKLSTFLCLFLWLSPDANIHAQSSIDITQDDLIYLNGKADELGLFDESELFFPPSNRFPKQKPKSFFRASYNQVYLPQEILIPLNGLYRMDSLWIYDGAGKDRVEVLIGNPKKWVQAMDFTTDTYNQWRSFSSKNLGEFILLRIHSSQAQIGEIRIFGKKIAKGRRQIIKLDDAAIHVTKSVAQIFGVNAFVDDPLETVTPIASSIREYHNWDWDEGNSSTDYKPTPSKKFAWSPSYVPSWDFDAYYRKAKERGLSVFPCLQGTAFPYRGERDFNEKPKHQNLLAQQPKAYLDHSAYVFQFAARYGAAKVDPAYLLLRSDQKVVSGLNLIAGLELWNEPDKWWKGREGYFHPFEFAALLSAGYDGHEGAIGKQFGLKNADPNLPLIMGGLAETNLDYLLGMKHWSDYNRKGDFPAQVLNFHHYSNNAGGQEGNSTGAVSPERDNLKQRIEQLVDFRNVNFPAQQVWLTEFGYDSNPKSSQGVPAIGNFSPEEVQAIWLLRAYLALAASGIDRAHLFMLRDVNAPNPNKYNSSGLTAEKWNKHAPKPAYFAIKSFLDLLGDYHFAKELRSNREGVYIYEFEHKGDRSRIWAVWLGTESAQVIFANKIEIPSTAVEVYELDENFGLKKTSRLCPDKSIKLKITEKPLFLKWMP
jgi:hypothetical protein